MTLVASRISGQEHKQMTADNAVTKPTGTPSLRSTLSVEEWWADLIKPSRQRNLTPLQRKELASHLRLFRRAKWDPTLVELS
jgi:hypothetical protein